MPEPLGGAHNDPPTTGGKFENASAQTSERTPRAAGRRTVEKALRKIPRPRAFPRKSPAAAGSQAGSNRFQCHGPRSRHGLISVLYPLTFHPIFKERVWGGREMERLYGKKLPPGAPIGESWEISDRPGDASVIANGPLAGQKFALAHGKSRGANFSATRNRQRGTVSRCSAKFSTRGKNFRCKSIRRRTRPPNSAANRKPKCGSSPTPRPARNCLSASNAA